MTANRHRLTALVAARTKLDTAACLAKSATVDLASSGLLPREGVQQIAAALDAYVQRVDSAIEKIP